MNIRLAHLHARVAQDASESGSVLVYAILFPVSLLLIAMAVQIGLIGHANNLLSAAAELGVDTEGRSDNDIALDVGTIALGEFGKATGYQLMTKRAPKPRHRQTWS